MNKSDQDSIIEVELELENTKRIIESLKSKTSKKSNRFINLPYKMAQNNTTSATDPTLPSASILLMQNNDVTSLTSMLPEFKPTDNLSTFINAVDNLASFLEQKLTPNQCYIFHLAVLSKIKEGARDYLNFHNKTQWPDIRAALLQKYGDQRNEEILLAELRSTVQKRNESYAEYYDRIILAQNDLMQYVQLHELDVNILNFKRVFYQKQTLQIFCAGINDPYHQYLMNFDLTTLEDALNKCKIYDNKMQERNYMKYLKQTDRNSNKPIVRKNIPFNNHFYANQNNFPPLNHQPINQNNSNNNKPYFTNQHFLKANANTSNSRRQNFNNPNSRSYHPTPMSTQTINPNNNYKPQPMSIQRTHNRNNYNHQRPTFIAEELFNNECNEINTILDNENRNVEIQDDAVCNNTTQDYYNTQNFRLNASETEQT